MEPTNFSNYGVFIIDNRLHVINGCNQHVKTLKNNFKILIPKKILNENFKNYTNYEYVDEYINILNELGFSCRISDYDDSFIGNQLDTSAGRYRITNDNCVCIEIDYLKYTKLHYYTFCMIRHLYYYNDENFYYFLKALLESSDKINDFSDLYHNYYTISTPSYSLLMSNNRFNIKHIMYLIRKDSLITNGNFGMCKNYNSSFKNEQYNDINMNTVCIPTQKNYFLVKNYEKSKYKLYHDNYDIINKNKISKKSLDTNYKLTDYKSLGRIPVINKDDNFYSFINLNKEDSFKIINLKNKFLSIKSRHPSHNIFRKKFKTLFKGVARFGSITNTGVYDFEINSIQAIKNSSDKSLMKHMFFEHGVNCCLQYSVEDVNSLDDIYPIVAKHRMGSRGKGNYKFDTREEFIKWSKNKRNLDQFIFEKYYNYSKEYRIHVSKISGVFLMWRKMRKLETDPEQMWFFNNQNCVWISETNELFDCPKTIEVIKNDCINALNSVGLDIGAIDVRVQSNERKSPDWKIIEINSAPSMSEISGQKYSEEIEKFIENFEKHEDVEDEDITNAIEIIKSSINDSKNKSN